MGNGDLARVYTVNANPGSGRGNEDADSIPTGQSRFYIPGDPPEIMVSQHGVIGMLVVDDRPRNRFADYDYDVPYYYDKNSCGEGKRARAEKLKELAHDPERCARYVDTAEGKMIARVFVLPEYVKNFFKGDKFLGDPMILKLTADGVFDDGVGLEESDDYENMGDLLDALIIGDVAAQAWEQAGLDEPVKGSQWQIWVSFHGNQFFDPAKSKAQEAVRRSIANFDACLNKCSLEPKQSQRPSSQRPYQPGDSSLVIR